MQKILQLNQNRQMPLGTGMAPSTSGQAMPTEGGMNNDGPATLNPAPQPAPQPGQVSNPSQVQSILVWEGVLSFNGTGTDGNKKEVRTAVSASSSNAVNRYGLPDFLWLSEMLTQP
jgi:hypothetical protein